jgi:hypothetical protein
MNITGKENNASHSIKGKNDQWSDNMISGKRREQMSKKASLRT